MNYTEDRIEFVKQNLLELVECTNLNSELINHLLPAKLVTTSEHQALVSENRLIHFPSRSNRRLLLCRWL